MRRWWVVGLSAVLIACAAPAPPKPEPARPVPAPAARDVVFDFEAGNGRAIDRTVALLREELQRKQLPAEVATQGSDAVVVRKYRGDLEALIAMAGGRRSVWVAPTTIVDLRYLADPLPPGVEVAKSERPSEIYARAITPDESALRAWIASTHAPAGHVVLIGEDETDPGYVRTFVVSRTQLASNFETMGAKAGADGEGAFADIFVDGPASEALMTWTRENVGRRIAVISHGRVLTAPIVTEPALPEKLGAHLRIRVGRGDDARKLADELSALWHTRVLDSGLRLRGVDPALY